MENLEALSFEQALAELEATLHNLEEGAQSLEESVTLYQRGRSLTLYCQQLLDDVELRIRQLAPEGSGEAGLAPFDPD